MRVRYALAIAAALVVSAACGGSSSPARTPPAEQESMRQTAVDFLHADMAQEHDTMMSMTDGASLVHADLARGCGSTDGCPARDLRNMVVNAGATTCRDATSDEASRGYGALCRFDLRFEQRTVDASGDFSPSEMCVSVQQIDARNMVVDARTACNATPACTAASLAAVSRLIRRRVCARRLMRTDDNSAVTCSRALPRRSTAPRRSVSYLTAHVQRTENWDAL